MNRNVKIGIIIVVIIAIVGVGYALGSHNHEPSTCPLCGKTGLYIGEMNDTTIYSCYNCGIHFFSKYTNEGTLIKFYYYENETIPHNKTYG